MSMVNVGNLAQELAGHRAKHIEESNKIGADIVMLEQKLGEMNERRHRHLGAAQAMQEMIQAIQQQMQDGPSGNPAGDPNAESDD